MLALAYGIPRGGEHGWTNSTTLLASPRLSSVRMSTPRRVRPCGIVELGLDNGAICHWDQPQAPPPPVEVVTEGHQRGGTGVAPRQNTRRDRRVPH
jgi:hypothetical protein